MMAGGTNGWFFHARGILLKHKISFKVMLNVYVLSTFNLNLRICTSMSAVSAVWDLFRREFVLKT